MDELGKAEDNELITLSKWILVPLANCSLALFCNGNGRMGERRSELLHSLTWFSFQWYVEILQIHDNVDKLFHCVKHDWCFSSEMLLCGPTQLKLCQTETLACGSGLEPASCYWKVAGSIPLVLHVEVSLGEILNPKLLLMCWSAPCMAATAISECMYELLGVTLDKSFG